MTAAAVPTPVSSEPEGSFTLARTELADGTPAVEVRFAADVAPDYEMWSKARDAASVLLGSCRSVCARRAPSRSAPMVVHPAAS